MKKYTVNARLHSRKNKDGSRAIYITYTYQRDTKVIPTGLTIAEELWDVKRKLVSTTCSDAARYNAKIQQAQSDILNIADGLHDPQFELVKRKYADLAYAKSKQEFNKYLDLAINTAEHDQIEEAEKELAQQQEKLQQRKRAFLPTKILLKEHGIVSKEDEATERAVKELADLFLEYAGTGEPIPGQFHNNKKPRLDQGAIKHYKPDTYKHVRSMWHQLQAFSVDKKYPLTVQSINMSFYKQFGDYVLFDKNNYDNHFGSLIKRVKTFMLWCESDATNPVTLHPQFKSKKFRALSEENEVIILSDDVYEMLDRFRKEPECRESWIKYIDMTLFQSAMGLRHSDMRVATWRVEGKMVDGVDQRVIKGSTQKNKSKYMIPIHLNPAWTIDILEQYEFDFNLSARSTKNKKSEKMVSEQRLNATMKLVLEALSKKYGVLNQRITVYKKKWEQPYEVAKSYQRERNDEPVQQALRALTGRNPGRGSGNCITAYTRMTWLSITNAPCAFTGPWPLTCPGG